MKKDKRNKPGRKKQPKKAERINKKYRTNKDTISLNVEQFAGALGIWDYPIGRQLKGGCDV
jgi:hypothetical protein